MAAKTFKEAGDALCLSAAELAELLRMPVQSVRQARLSPKSARYRSPPAGWEAKLAKLARKRARELERLVEELERNLNRRPEADGDD